MKPGDTWVPTAGVFGGFTVTDVDNDGVVTVDVQRRVITKDGELKLDTRRRVIQPADLPAFLGGYRKASK